MFGTELKHRGSSHAHLLFRRRSWQPKILLYFTWQLEKHTKLYENIVSAFQQKPPAEGHSSLNTASNIQFAENEHRSHLINRVC